MAKWGEGDPRWIVEERPDATNVNNWHWSEKNADNWSKSKLSELFENLIIEDEKIGNVMIEKLEKVEGEARVNNRKAKLIFFYEWELKMTFSGHVNGKEDPKVEGTVEIPNLSEEHEDMKDVDVDISIKKSNPESQIIKEMMRKGTGAKIIRETLQKYVNALRNEFCQGLIKPAKDSKAAAVASVAKQTKVTSSSTVINKTPSEQLKNMGLGGCKIATSSMDIKEPFKCTGQELYNALTQKEMLQIFTDGQVKMEKAAKGESFEMIGGNVQGVFLELEPFTKIVQKWRLKSWPSGHYAIAELCIKQGKDDTTLAVSLTEVPEKEVENTRMGWKRYYFESIKRVFGFGSSLF